MKPDEGEFAGEAFMRRLQIVRDVDVKIGSALMSGGGGEPMVGRTLVLELEHRTNQSTAEATTTIFGLGQGDAVELCGKLLVSIDVAWGTEVMQEMLVAAAEIAGRIAAETEGENDDR